jgi:cell division protein FtsB
MSLRWELLQDVQDKDREIASLKAELKAMKKQVRTLTHTDTGSPERSGTPFRTIKARVS